MAILKVEKVSKVYDDEGVPVHALDGVSFEIQKGEFTAITGPSGSGKTTLLNMIGGLDKPSDGRVWIDRQDITTLAGSKRIDFRLHHIGFVFQAYNLIPVLTAAENVEFIMLLQGRPKQERVQRTRELLSSVGLGDRLDSRPTQLSGGQQQRVAVARALASRPEFILADEPTANLDSESSGRLLDIMGQLNREREMTFIFATHDPRVMSRARRIITMLDGRIESDRTAEDDPGHE
ncbi:MAG: ABC transporter ATP-binding protein [bacterium]|jgi:putative ABC transport system ATP-binding protein